MSGILAANLKTSLDRCSNSYKQLMDDVIAGKMTLKQLQDKHSDLYDATVDHIKEILEYPIPDIIIELCNGELQDVYSGEHGVTYIVYEADEDFDHYAVKMAKKFDKYEDLIEDLDASYITVEDLEIEQDNN